ncbi:MAG: hypothetical protein ORO03_09020, partial [Alphaproteobacteria bacterium]|nr:hypothetical protein [Alphaproteobacteria bacterium]
MAFAVEPAFCSILIEPCFDLAISSPSAVMLKSPIAAPPAEFSLTPDCVISISPTASSAVAARLLTLIVDDMVMPGLYFDSA